MKNISILIFLLLATHCFSQGGGLQALPAGVNTNNGLMSSNSRYGSINGKGVVSYEEALKEYEEIDDSPFLHGGDIVVDIISNKDSVFHDVIIKYDIYGEELIVIGEDGTTMILDQRYYKGFVYDNEGEKEFYLRLQPRELRYYQVLFKDNDFIFCKKIKTTIVAETRHVPGQDIKPKKFNHNADYYVMHNTALIGVRLKKGTAVEYFPSSYRQQVPRVKNELKIKRLNKEEDYIRVLREIQSSSVLEEETN